MENSVISKVIDQMETLPADLQQLVLEFVRTLKTSAHQGIPGRHLLRFAGSIPVEDLSLMHGAILAECERVELNEW